MNTGLIVDIDLTLYSLAEFLSSHPGRVDRWAQALWRFDEDAADQAIDHAWLKWEPAIASRILYFNQWSETRYQTPALFLTANPLTPSKVQTFTHLRCQALSSYPNRKTEFVKQSEQLAALNPELSVGDRQTDAPLGKHFLHLPILGRHHRLTGDRYTDALKELLCFKASKI
ncbi:MAG: hypothetical protein IPJ84_15670 [Bdellovibrionales bacterium]|nr:hypothetical protein [Bdellovibrionales bacterium]